MFLNCSKSKQLLPKLNKILLDMGLGEDSSGLLQSLDPCSSIQLDILSMILPQLKHCCRSRLGT